MDLAFIETLKSALATGKPFALATIVGATGSSPQKPGAKMIVFEDRSIHGTVGGGAIEHTIIADAVEVLAAGAPLLRQYDLARDAGMVCGGGMTAFIEPMSAGDRVVLFGCGHVSRALAPLLAGLGFAVTVVDDRPEWADPAAFPASVTVACADLDPYLQGLDGPVDDLYVLSLTRGHRFDYKVLRHFIEVDRRYLGVMASKKKALEFRKALVEEGLDESLLETVHMPVGIPIGSSSPSEIAVSIAGELISVRRKARSAKTSGQS